MRKVWKGLVAGSLLWAMAAGSAGAQFNQSQYTDINLDACTVVQSDDFGSTWACNGHKGIPVMIAEGERRMMVSYGLTSTVEPAAKQTLPPFNRLGDSIEWRLSNASGGYKPFATIVRFLVDGKTGADGAKGPDGEVLVVTRIVPGATCQVAWVDALANEDAEEMARQAADELAPEFDCSTEPEIIGTFEAWDR